MADDLSRLRITTGKTTEGESGDGETASRFSNSSSEGDDIGLEAREECEEIASYSPTSESASPGTHHRSGRSLWDELKDLDLGDLDDPDADLQLNAALRSVAFDADLSESATTVDTEYYEYDFRPRSPLYAESDDELWRSSVRWYHGYRETQFDMRARESRPKDTRGKPTPLRKVRSVDDLSPERSSSKRGGLRRWIKELKEEEDEWEKDSDGDNGDDDEEHRHSSQVAEGATATPLETETSAETSPGGGVLRDVPQHDTGEPPSSFSQTDKDHAQHSLEPIVDAERWDSVGNIAGEPPSFSTRLSAEIDEIASQHAYPAGDPSQAPTKEDPPTPSSVEELEMVTGVSLDQAMEELRQVYKEFEAERFSERFSPLEMLQFKRQLLKSRSEGLKYNGIDDERLQPFMESLVPAYTYIASHLYRTQRNECRHAYKEERERRRDAERLVEEDGYEISMLKHRVQCVEKALQSSTKDSAAWRDAYEKAMPFARIEMERRERREDGLDGMLEYVGQSRTIPDVANISSSQETQTELFECDSCTAASADVSRPVKNSAESRLSGTQTIFEEPPIEYSQSKPTQLAPLPFPAGDRKSTGSDPLPLPAGPLAGLRICARWREREAQMRKSETWKRDRDAILKHLRAETEAAIGRPMDWEEYHLKPMRGGQGVAF